MTTNEKYFEYLRQRSRLSLWYRRYWLYPKLSDHVNGRVLDVGCGIGDFLNHRPGTVGVDINPATVEWCRQHGMDAHLMAPDVLHFVGAEFDSVVLDNVLEHLEQPAPLLSEIHRVLRLDGVVVVGVPGQRGYACDPDHKVFYDEDLLISTMIKAGFTLQRVFAMPFRSSWLNAQMRQYCLYGVFLRG